MKVVHVVAACALLLPLTAAAAEPWVRIGEVGAGWDSNAGNAGHHKDVKDAGFAYVTAYATHTQRYGLLSALEFRASLGAEQYFDLEDLSNLRATARLRYLLKPGMGVYTPVYAVWASAGRRDFGSRIRDSNEFRGGVTITETLTTALQFRGEASYSKRVAAGRAYDLGLMSWGANLDWTGLGWGTLYGGVRYDDGDFVVVAQGHGEVTPKTEHLYLKDKVDAIEPDPAFGGDWWAFRANGQTVVTTAGLNVPLSADWALDFQMQRGAASMGRFDYDRWQGSASLLARF